MIAILAYQWYCGNGFHLVLADRKDLQSLLGLTSAVVGLFASLVFYFCLMVFQTLEAEKLQIYLALRAQVDRLEDLARSLPDDTKWLPIRTALGTTLDWLVATRLENLPIVGDEWQTLSKPLEEGHAAGLEYGSFSDPSAPFDRLLANLMRLEEYGSQLGVHYVRVIGAGILADVAIKAFACVGITLIGLLLVTLVPETPWTTTAANAIAITAPLFGLLLILELATWLARHHRDLMESMNQSQE